MALNIAEIWSHWLELAISLGLLVLSTALAGRVIRKTRAETLQHEPRSEELLSKFRDSYERGDLNDSEFRTIKTMLAEQLHDELKDDGQKG